MFKKIIALTMTALFICGLLVVPASADAVDTEVVFHDNMANVDGERIVTNNMQTLGELTEEQILFPGYKYRRGFDNKKPGQNYIIYNVAGLDVDKMEIRFINSSSKPMAEGKIKVAYSQDNVAYTDFAAVEPTFVNETTSGNNRHLFTYTFHIIPDCNYIKIYDTEAMDFGSCTLVDFVLSRNVIEGIAIDNGIEFVEFHDDMTNVKNASNVWVPADATRIPECNLYLAGPGSSAPFGYTKYRKFDNDSAVNHITYNVEGLDINTLKAVFTCGNKMKANTGEATEHIKIEYSTDGVTYTRFPKVQTIYSAAPQNSQHLNTFVIRDIPACKYIKISDSATVSAGGSNFLRDVKLSKIYGETYSYVATATSFAVDEIAKSASNMSFINTPGDKALAGYDYRMTFPKTAGTSNAVGEMVWNVDGVDFNQLRLMFLGGQSPAYHKIQVEYSANGTTWSKYTDATDDASLKKPTLWSDATTNGSVALYTWIISNVNEDWKYIKISGPAVSSDYFYLAELQLRNNKAETIVTESCVSDLTDASYVAGSEVTGTITIENYTGYVSAPVSIMALYKGNQLVDVDLNNSFSLTANYQETTDVLSLTLPQDYTSDGNYQLKVFVWNSLDKMIPLFAVE